MVFGLNFYYSLFYSYLVSCYCRDNNYGVHTALILFSPVFIVWLILCGGQYEVGTDYESYIDLFSGGDLHRYIFKGEILFVYIVNLCNNVGLRGQALFYIFYFINFIFLALIIKRFKSRQLFLFVLLYIVVTSLFNNQLNILRQTTACYIGSYAGMLIFENKRKKGFLFIVISFMIHNAAIVYLLIPLLNKIVRNLTINKLVIILIVCSIVGMTFNINFFLNFIPYLPADYAWHIQGGAVEDRQNFLIIMKYIYFPLYLLSLYHFSKRKENFKRIKVIFNWGILAYALRLLVVNFTVISRIFDFFLIFSIFPLLFYLHNISIMRKNLYYLIIAYLIAIYSAKVLLFPVREYAYKSIYFL